METKSSLSCSQEPPLVPILSFVNDLEEEYGLKC